jgi:hypothetical protein
MSKLTLPELKNEIQALDAAVRELLGKGGNLNGPMRELGPRLVSPRNSPARST